MLWLVACGPQVVDLGGPVDARVVYPSCDRLHAAEPTLRSGVYDIQWLGSAKPTYCDMELQGGGWTAFFVGVVGHDLTFAHFGTDAEKCPDPAARCLRRLPPAASTTWQFAVTCGTDAITFSLGAPGIDYFVSGGHHDWQPLAQLQVGHGNPDLSTARNLWTGVDVESGWILSADDMTGPTPHTFASSYDLNANWDYCNGKPDHGSTTRLFFR